MPKSNLIRDVEEIANRISRKNIKESRASIQLGTWVKTLVDELKAVKQRLDEIDIRVKKINAYGATTLTPAEAEGEKQAAAAPVVRVKPGELKHYRLTRHLSQAAMGALLGVTQQKYARWEFGKSVMLAAIEEKFREVQELSGSALRTRLQELGIFQANGKQTRYRRGQAKEASAPAAASAPKKEPASPLIITKAQIRELRLALGYTHRDMADLMNSKPKHYSNWEYGACRPPEKIALKLLALYNERVAKTDAAPLTPYQRPVSKRRIYESELMPIAQIRAGRAASGLTCSEVAKRLNVPLTTYKNWEYGNSKPSPQYVEQMIQIFGAPPTPSVRAATKTHASKGVRRTKHEDGYPIPFDELRAFRGKLGLSASQMAALIGIERPRYSNWESRGRGVPPDFVSTVKMLQSLSREKLQKRCAEVGISAPAKSAESNGGKKSK